MRKMLNWLKTRDLDRVAQSKPGDWPQVSAKFRWVCKFGDFIYILTLLQTVLHMEHKKSINTQTLDIFIPSFLWLSWKAFKDGHRIGATYFLGYFWGFPTLRVLGEWQFRLLQNHKNGLSVWDEACLWRANWKKQFHNSCSRPDLYWRQFGHNCWQSSQYPNQLLEPASGVPCALPCLGWNTEIAGCCVVQWFPVLNLCILGRETLPFWKCSMLAVDSSVLRSARSNNSYL